MTPVWKIIRTVLKILTVTLLLSGCTLQLALPVTAPVWLIVSFLLISRPVLKGLWYVLTGLIVFPIVVVSVFGYFGRHKSEGERQAHYLMLVILGLVSLIVALFNFSFSAWDKIIVFMLELISAALIAVWFSVIFFKK